MHLTRRPKRAHLASILCTGILILMTGSGVEGQTGPAQGIRKYIRVGRLQHYVDAYGSERAYNGSYYEGMIWPADYDRQDNFVIRRYWVSTLGTSVGTSWYLWPAMVRGPFFFPRRA